MGANFPFILYQKKKKNLLFLFYTSNFTKHPHQFIYSFFYNFLLFSPSLPLSFTDPILPTITPHLASIITHPTSIIKENQPTQSEKQTLQNSLPSETQSIDALVSSLVQSKTSTIDFITNSILITPIDAPQLHSSPFRTPLPYLKKKRDKVTVETRWIRRFFCLIRSKMRREWIFAFSFFV